MIEIGIETAIIAVDEKFLTKAIELIEENPSDLLNHDEPG